MNSQNNNKMVVPGAKQAIENLETIDITKENKKFDF